MERIVGAILVAILSAHTLAAQQCEAVLGYTRDITETQSSLQATYSFKRFFCDQTFSSYQEAHDRGAKLGILIDDFPVSFAGYDRGSQWSQYQHTVCEAIEINSGLSTEFRQYIAKANVAVVDAWKDCVNSAGLHFWGEANEGDPSLIDLVARYNGLQRQYEVKIKPLEVTPPSALQCKSSSIDSRRFLNNQESRVSCKRVGTNDTYPGVNVILPTGAGARSVKFGAIMPKPEFQEVTEEKSVPCVKYRHDFIQDGPKYGDKHIFHVECSAPGPITRWKYQGCEGGACPWLVLLPGDDRNFGNFVAVRFATNSSDPITVTTIVLYNTTYKKCIKHCENGPLTAVPIE